MIEILERVRAYLLEGDHPIELLKLFVAAATAYLTVSLSLKKFLKEKHWERKHSAYSNIMEALHHLKRSEERFIEQEENDNGDGVDRSKFDEVIKRSSSARSELQKYIDLGRFYISQEALDALEKLEKVHQECVDEWKNSAPELIDLYMKELEAVQQCLKIVRAVAMKEIRHIN